MYATSVAIQQVTYLDYDAVKQRKYVHKWKAKNI